MRVSACPPKKAMPQDTGSHHQWFVTIYYYIKEPGKSSGDIGVSLLQAKRWHSDWSYILVDDCKAPNKQFLSAIGAEIDMDKEGTYYIMLPDPAVHDHWHHVTSDRVIKLIQFICCTIQEFWKEHDPTSKKFQLETFPKETWLFLVRHFLIIRSAYEFLNFSQHMYLSLNWDSLFHTMIYIIMTEKQTLQAR